MRCSLPFLALLLLACHSEELSQASEEKPALVLPELDQKADFAQTVALKGTLAWELGYSDEFTQHFEFHRYSLEISQAAPFRLEITQAGTSRSLDTSLFLFGPRRSEEQAGPLIAQDDDSGWGLHARLDLEGLEPGEYTAVVGTATALGRGQYQLRLSCNTPGTCTDSADCFDEDLGTALGLVAEGSTQEAEDLSTGSCGYGPAPEQRFLWEAPEAGVFEFDTFGTSFGTVLYLIEDDGSCNGVELACNNNAGDGSYQSKLSRAFEMGERALIILDGYNRRKGEFQLNINGPWSSPSDGCPERIELEEATQVGQRAVSYDSARRYMFSTLDNHDGQVQCVYSAEWLRTSGIPNHEVMNTEHTWPKSRGADFSPARSDLHHLFPVMNEVNSARSSYPFGEVSDPVERYGPASLGWSAEGDFLFEPRSEQKGDVARALFYFAIRYSLKIDEDEEAAIRRWHLQDPVSGAEQRRNDGVEMRQGNRNPFIDHPQWVDCVSDF